MDNPSGNWLATTASEAPPAPGISVPNPVNIEPQAPPDAPAPSPQKKPRGLLSIILGMRWVLAIPAILLAFYAEQITEQARTAPLNISSAPPLQSWQLFGLAALLLVIAGLPVQALLPSGPSAFLKDLRALSRLRKVGFLGLLLLAVVAGAASVPLFMALNQDLDSDVTAHNWLVNTGSWLLFITSLVSFCLAFVIWERKAPSIEEGTSWGKPADRLPRPVEWGLMAGLLALALWLRVPNLDNVPPGLWFDEAQYGLDAQRLLAPDAYHSVFIAGTSQLGALYFYLVGFLIQLFGPTITPLRIIPAVAGALSIPLLYMLASRLYGWRVGLSAAGLTAVSAWHITFSRFGLMSMLTVAIDVAVYLCFAQALRTGRLGYYAAGGVLLGLGIHTYYPSKLAVFVIAAVLLHRLVTERMRLLRAGRAGILVFGLGLLLAAIPIGLFAVQQPETYNSRVNTTSIFSDLGSGGNANALQLSIDKHMLMFNWQGDSNGRHNLSNTPMLDWVTAALFFFGLGACILRAWRWQYFFPVIWFAASLVGGVFSLLFEAPQSSRTVENSIVTTFIAGIALGEVLQILTGSAMVERLGNLFKWFRRGTAQLRYNEAPKQLGIGAIIGWALGGAAALALVWWVGGMNYHRYFEVQAKSPQVWKDMYTAEAQAGHVTRRYGVNYDIYIAPILNNLPTNDYLSPNVKGTDWPGMQALPLPNNKPGGTVLVLDPSTAADVAAIARMYPHAKFEILAPPGTREALVYIIIIPSSDIQALYGVHAVLYDEGSTTPRSEETIPQFSYDWSKPDARPGTVRLSTTLKVDSYNTFKFDWKGASDSPDSGQVLVDGYLLTSGQQIALGSGMHSIVATDTVKSASGVSELSWAIRNGPPTALPQTILFDPSKVEPHGLTATFRRGDGFDEAPTTSRVDGMISFYFQLPALARPYTIEWNGRIRIPTSGNYNFATEQLASSQLFIDDKMLIDNNSVNVTMDRMINLQAGWHDIKVLYKDNAGYSHMYLYWTPPGRPRSIIPSAFLWPQMGQYPDKPASGSFPNLDESVGTELPQERVTFVTQDGNVEPQANAPVAQQPAPTKQPIPEDTGPAPTEQPQTTQQTGQENQAKPKTPSAAAKAMNPLVVIGEKDDKALPLPRAAAADDKGNIYIFTEKDSQIHKFDSTGKETLAWALKAQSGGPVTEVSAMWVKDGNLLVLDSDPADMLTFSLDGNQIGGRQHMCQCFRPRGFALALDGNYWIADTGGNQVLKVSPEGQQIQRLGGQGSAPGKFAEPSSIWESPQGTVIVADISNHRVQTFDSTLNPATNWPIGNSIARDGNRLVGDQAGNILVTQYDDKAVVMYDKSGKELNRWAYPNANDALIPSGIASIGGDKFIALYPGNNKAVVFSTK